VEAAKSNSVDLFFSSNILFIIQEDIMGKKILMPLTLIMISLFMLTGCSAKESPGETLNSYLTNWSELKYDEMFELTDESTKSQLSKEMFASLYDEFNDTLQTESLTYELALDKDEIDAAGEDADSVDIPVTIQVDFPNGSIKSTMTFPLIKTSEGQWKVKWDHSLIWDGMSEEGSLTKTHAAPTRGEIIDRTGKALAQNGYVIQIGIVPGRLGNMKNEIISDISEAFGISESYITDRLSLSWVGEDTFVDLVKVPKDQESLIKEIRSKNNGATYREISDRVYPYKESAAHLTGYIGYPSEEDLKILEPLGFSANDKIGKTGLEKAFDKRLRGILGTKISIVDGQGSIVKVIYEKKAVDGENINLTIDGETQKKLYSQMSDEKAAASVLNYKTGELVALVSSPSYDPNDFILGMSSSEYSSLVENDDKPLSNRFSNIYSPGSTFKPITAAIGLNELIFDETFSIDVTGKTWQKDSSWGGYHITRVTPQTGSVDLEKAMIYSDNIYFAQAALEIGSAAFLEKSKDFGIGQALAMEYGLKKSQLANNDNIDSEILLADTGYGQGQVLVNVVDLSKAYSTFANGGIIIEPILLADSGEAVKTQIVSKEIADKILNLLEKVVENPQGTGHDAYISGKEIAGKTGTAEIENPSNPNQKDELGWFVAIDKSQQKPYITSMMIEDVQNRGGSHLTAKKVKSFIESY
jgi:penicillin-binding protein